MLFGSGLDADSHTSFVSNTRTQTFCNQPHTRPHPTDPGPDGVRAEGVHKRTVATEIEQDTTRRAADSMHWISA